MFNKYYIQKSRITKVISLIIAIVMSQATLISASPSLKNVSFNPEESVNRTQTHVITIPDLGTLENIEVDTGTISVESVVGDKVTVKVMNGERTRREQTGGTYTAAHTKEVTGQPSANYSSGGYSGTLTKYLYSGDVIPYDEMYYETFLEGNSMDIPMSGRFWNYSKDGYSGVLEYRGYTQDSFGRYQHWYDGNLYRPEKDTRVWKYEGNVTKPESDTRTWQDYYKYNIIINYDPVPKPIIDSVAYATAITNKDIELTVNMQNGIKYLDQTGAYSFDNGNTWQTSNKKKINANGTYSVAVKNKIGEIGVKTVKVTNIDKIRPNLSIKLVE